MFLASLLLALIAPAGLAFGLEQSKPYIVVFDDESVAVRPAERPGREVVALDETRRALAGLAKPDHRAIVDDQRVAERVRHFEAKGRFRAGNVYSSVVGGFAARLSRAQMQQLQRDPSVAAIVPDEEVVLDHPASLVAGGVRTTANTDGRVPAGIRRVGAVASSVAQIDGQDQRVNVDVAIIDTGIERSHPDLNVVGGYNCTGANRDAWGDGDGHGTHVAGIVGAIDNRFGVVGVAPGARLWSVKVLDSNGSGFVSWILCGIDWVTAQRERGDASEPRIEVANMSLSWGMSGSDRYCGETAHDVVHLAVCRSVGRGTVYAVAAGNESRDARLNRPGAYDEVLTVSAMADYDGRGGGNASWSASCPYWTPDLDDAFANFSNYGADVDFTAPGRCVLSTYTGKRYAWLSGTSMASPHVAGAAALYRDTYPWATPAQVKLALQSVGKLDWRTSTDPDTVKPEKLVWVGTFRQPPSFSFSATDPQRVTPGSQAAVPVSVARDGGFDETVTVRLGDAPDGFTASPRYMGGSTSTLYVRVATTVVAGTYEMTLTATAAGIERSQTIAVVVYGSPPSVSVMSPPSTLTVQSDTFVGVAWTETEGGSAIVDRRVTRLAGRIRQPGSCQGVTYSTDVSRSRGGAFTDQVPAGYCYRWRVTVTDGDGLFATATSGSVLVDATAPSTPVVRLVQTGSSAVNPDALGVDAAHLDQSGTLWVRSGEAGTARLDVTGRDPESGVAAHRAGVAGEGWLADWAGDSATGALRLHFTAVADGATLSLAAVNGVGMRGADTTLALARDGRAPTVAEWVSLPAGTTSRITVRSFRLDWAGAEDAASGVAQRHVVRRWRTPQNANGACRSGAWALDGEPVLTADRELVYGLTRGYCYSWGVRMLDNVGNYSAESVSGTLIVLPN